MHPARRRRHLDVVEDRSKDDPKLEVLEQVLLEDRGQFLEWIVEVAHLLERRTHSVQRLGARLRGDGKVSSSRIGEESLPQRGRQDVKMDIEVESVSIGDEVGRRFALPHLHQIMCKPKERLLGDFFHAGQQGGYRAVTSGLDFGARRASYGNPCTLELRKALYELIDMTLRRLRLGRPQDLFDRAPSPVPLGLELDRPFSPIRRGPVQGFGAWFDGKIDHGIDVTYLITFFKPYFTPSPFPRSPLKHPPSSKIGPRAKGRGASLAR